MKAKRPNQHLACALLLLVLGVFAFASTSEIVADICVYCLSGRQCRVAIHCAHCDYPTDDCAVYDDDCPDSSEKRPD
jgi:hypothetical protein